ncbi:uncharacterized protein LOC144120252 [Amblyomma americanum]
MVSIVVDIAHTNPADSGLFVPLELTAAAPEAQAEQTTAPATETGLAVYGGQLPKAPAAVPEGQESPHGTPTLMSRSTVLEADKKPVMDTNLKSGTTTNRTLEGSWVSNREGRGRTSTFFMAAVLGGTLFLLALVVILVIRFQKPLVCHSAICDYYSSLLSESLEPNADPCTDFHQFISKVSMHAWKTAVPSSGQSTSQKGAMFYKSCYGVYKSKQDHLEELKSSLLSADVIWPEANSNASLLRMLFSLMVEWNWASPIHFILYRPGNLEVKPTALYAAMLEKRKVMLQNTGQGSYYADYYERLVQAFSRPDIKLSAIESRVISTLLVPMRLPNWRSMTNASLDDVMALLQDALPRDLWEEELSTLCNKTGERGSVQFTIFNVDFFSAFFSLVKSEGEHRMTYYVGWCVVLAASQMANNDLLRYSYQSDKEVQTGHVTFCYALSRHYMGLAFYADYINREIVSSAMRGAASMIRNIRDVFRAKIKNPKTRALFLDIPLLNVESDPLDVLQLEKEFEEKSLAETYKHFPDMVDYAMENIARATAAARQTEVDIRMKGYRSGGFPCVFLFKPGGFELLPIAFEVPLYDDQALLCTNYGPLGSYVATAFTELLFEALIKEDSDTLMEFEIKSSCFYESLQEAGNETLLDANNLELMKRAVAVRMLYSSFWPINRRKTPMRLSGHPLITEKQLLFIFWCISQCGTPNARDKCNVPLKAFRIFGVTFGCSKAARCTPAASVRCWSKPHCALRSTAFEDWSLVVENSLPKAPPLNYE